MQEREFHKLFQASVLLKGAHALLECTGGLALAFIGSNTIVRLVERVTQDELIEDRHDFVATHLLSWVEGFSVQTQHFYAFYLLSHGIVKLLLVVALLRNKLWAYPASLVVMGLFIAYQLYRFSYTHGPGLLVLTVFDIAVIGLIWHEYRFVRQRSVPR